MRNIITAVRDVVADRFLGINLESSDAVAERNFLYTVRNARDGILSSNPGDFWLMCLGEFDTETGEIFPSTPRVIVRGDNA